MAAPRAQGRIAGDSTSCLSGASPDYFSHFFGPLAQIRSMTLDVVLRRGSLGLHPIFSLVDRTADEAARRSAGVWGKQERRSDTRCQAD